MLMNRTFFQACAMIVTLGIAAASSAPAYARCSDADSAREERSCWIRSIISRAEAAASEAARSAKPKGSRDGSTANSTGDSKTTQSTTSTPDTKTNAASSPATCGLTKEYVNGVVKFRDTCTGEWAEGTVVSQPNGSR
jgi:hypothetical protein